MVVAYRKKVIRLGDLEINLDDRIVQRSGQFVRLTRLEWQLLEVLVQHAGAVISHARLLHEVWGDTFGIRDTYLRVYIGRLRRKLGDDSGSPRYILTEHDIGYRFVLPPQRSPAQTLPTLPIPLTPLIGREHEVAQISAILQRDTVRLLTLTGPAGIGKTRLALQVATDLQARFADGVFFVEMAFVHDRTLVLPTIARSIGLAEVDHLPIAEHLHTYVRHRDLLLILNNLEHLVTAAPDLADLLGQALRLRMLVTSRVALHVYGEHAWQVPPLRVPMHAAILTIDELRAYSAVALFEVRARAVQSNFVLTNDVAPAVLAICQRLDGIPLAIELAAARSALFSPPALLERLMGRAALHMLAGGPQNLPERHRAIRKAIDWSYDLLDPAAQRLFAGLSVFAGRFSFQAADAICNTADIACDTLESLTALVRQSLVQLESTSSDLPFRLLTIIREYALERLHDQHAADGMMQRFVAYYIKQAEADAPTLREAPSPIWLERVRGEEDNFRAVLDWLLSQGAIVELLRISSVLWPYWKAQSQLSEGRRWLEAVLERSASVASSMRGLCAYGAGVLAFQQGDYAGARRWFQEAVEGYRIVDDTFGLASALNMLGQVVYVQGDTSQAKPLLEEALVLQRTLANVPGIASALLHLGVVLLYLNDLGQANELQTESLALFRSLNDSAGQAWALNRLSQIALHQYDFNRAICSSEESIALQKRRLIPDTRCIAFALINLSLGYYYSGNVQKGVMLQQESLVLHNQLHNHDGLAWNLMILGAMGGQHGQYEHAARLYGAAERVREVADCPIPALSQEIYERDMAAIRAHCDPMLWSAAWAQGRAMDVQDAVALAESIRCPSEGEVL